MTNLNAQEREVLGHYETNVIDYEKIRLEHDSPVEYAITLRTLDRWIKNNTTVLDVGIGVGHYAHHLAKKGCFLHLVDICESFLNLTKKRFDDADMSHHILSATQTSATNLSIFENESVDCALMLGPLYHITEQLEREKAVKEAYRVLKKGGLLFAAAINRLAIFHELFNSDRFFKDKKVDIETINHDLEKYTLDGINNKTIFPPLGQAYCATVEEFRALLLPSFKEVDFLGVESFTAFHQKDFFNKENTPLWLNLIEKTARTIEGQSSSEHFLFVGSKS